MIEYRSIFQFESALSKANNVDDLKDLFSGIRGFTHSECGEHPKSWARQCRRRTRALVETRLGERGLQILNLADVGLKTFSEELRAGQEKPTVSGSSSTWITIAAGVAIFLIFK